MNLGNQIIEFWFMGSNSRGFSVWSRYLSCSGFNCNFVDDPSLSCSNRFGFLFSLDKIQFFGVNYHLGDS